MKLKTLISVLGILLPIISLKAQQHSIRGSVVDEQGHGIPYTFVSTTLSLHHQETDSSGYFELAIKLLDTLIFSHAGYVLQKLAVTSNSHQINIILKRVTALDEIVVSTGYQQIPKERATGSFVQIDNKIYNEQTGINVLDRLEGVSNGINFNKYAGPAIAIRGISSIKGPTSPLIVLDNFPYEGDISNLNPNDVESMTILKDAAAASIWGTKAGNGVIVITTKKGRKNMPLSVSVNANIRIQEKPDIFSDRSFIPATDYIDVVEWLFKNGYYNGTENNANGPALEPVVEQLIAIRDGKISESEGYNKIDAFRKFDIRNDIDRYLYRNTANQQYSASLRGGSEKAAYYFSSGFDKNINYLSDRYQRINLKSDNSFTPIKNLNLQLGITYTQSESNSGKSDYTDIFSSLFYPYAQLADAAGNALPIVKDRRTTYVDTAGNGRLLDWHYYPLDDYKHATSRNTQQDVVLNAGFQYRIKPWLSLDLKYMYEKQTGTTRNLQDTNSYVARNLVNSYTQINGTTGAVTYAIPVGGILNLNHPDMQSQNFRGQVNFDKSWNNNNNNITVVAGGEIRQIRTVTDQSKTYGFNDDLLTFSNVDYVNQFPTYVTGTMSYIPNGTAFSDKLNRFVSVYANGSYTYNLKYILTGSIRKDKSNLFGANGNNKGVPLWSIGTAWNLNQEQFFVAKVFSLFRLRATYGFNGNVDQSMSAVTTLLYSLNDYVSNLPVARVYQFANPDLKWEKTGMLNLGLDFRAGNSILSGSIEYYTKKGKDLFGNSPVDYTTGLGVSYIVKNVASMSGKGLDIEINSRNIDRIFKWGTGLILNYYANKVTKYYLTDTLGSNFTNNGYDRVNPVEGRPVYSILSYRWAGLDPQTGDPQGYLKGEVSKDYATITGTGTSIKDLVYGGSAIPQITGAIKNTFSYKRFSAVINLTFKLNYYFRKPSINYSDLFATGKGNIDFMDRWQVPGDETKTDIPSLVYPNSTQRNTFYNQSEILVRKGDHIRLQFINLSYDFNDISYTNKKWQFTGYVNMSNISIIWRANKDHIDPDYPASISPGKIITIGVKANF